MTHTGLALREFTRESSRIEGIIREPTDQEVEALGRVMRAFPISLDALRDYVQVCAGAKLRERPGMDVRVGNYVAPSGGPAIVKLLNAILTDAASDKADPWEVHVAYELLHPFMDGNGRSGRALWAWVMHNTGRDAFALPFLHRWYYQTLARQE